MQASGDRHIVVNKVSEIGLGYVLAGQYEKAFVTLEYAMSVVPLSAFANVRRAHVRMFLEKKSEARALYLQYREQRMTPKQAGANVILQDFERMLEFERVDPLMEDGGDRGAIQRFQAKTTSKAHTLSVCCLGSWIE